MKTRPIEIPKEAVWGAWLDVRANHGSAGIDAVSIEDFEKDLKNDLYKLWSRMSSGSYMPPPCITGRDPEERRGQATIGDTYGIGQDCANGCKTGDRTSD